MDSFTITPEQLLRIEEWLKQFEGRYTGAIGGAFTYCFTPTGLGVIVKVRDSVSGQELDVTDYDSW